MSYPTQPTFIKHGTWDDVTRSHPAMKFLENYTKNAIDVRAWDKGNSPSEWHTSDFTLYKANGEVFSGEEAWTKGISGIYAPFKSHLHDPNFLACWETKTGWEMIGQADLFANIRVPGNEPKPKDSTGKEWDMVSHSAFRFEYVKDSKANHDGVLLKSTRIFGDTAPALMLMLKRGQLKPADLGL